MGAVARACSRLAPRSTWSSRPFTPATPAHGPRGRQGPAPRAELPAGRLPSPRAPSPFPRRPGFAEIHPIPCPLRAPVRVPRASGPGPRAKLVFQARLPSQCQSLQQVSSCFRGLQTPGQRGCTEPVERLQELSPPLMLSRPQSLGVCSLTPPRSHVRFVLWSILPIPLPARTLQQMLFPAPPLSLCAPPPPPAFSSFYSLSTRLSRISRSLFLEFYSLCSQNRMYGPPGCGRQCLCGERTRSGWTASSQLLPLQMRA